MIIKGKIIASLDGMTILSNGKAKVIGSIISDIKVNGEESTVFNIVVFKLGDIVNFDLFIFDKYTGQLVNYAIGRQTPLVYQKLFKKVVKPGITIERFITDFSFEYINYSLSNA